MVTAQIVKRNSPCAAQAIVGRKESMQCPETVARTEAATSKEK